MKSMGIFCAKNYDRFNRHIRLDNALAVFLLAGALCSTTARGQSPPPNDLFANSIAITGTATNVTGSNVGASKEPGEPTVATNAGGKSVWWTWTAPTDGIATVDTVGSSFDTLLGVFTGTSVSKLSLLAGNDDSAGNGAGRVAFNVTAGTAYQIVVDGYNPGTKLNYGTVLLGTNPINAASGFIQLNISMGLPPPTITNQPQNLAVTNGGTATFGVAATGTLPYIYDYTFQWFKDAQ